MVTGPPMKTWKVHVIRRVENRLVKILSYIAEKPLYNPDAARAVLEDFEATVERISQMGDRVPIGTHPIMRKRNLRRMNFLKHDYFVIYRVRGDVAEIVRIGHSLENLEKVLK